MQQVSRQRSYNLKYYSLLLSLFSGAVVFVTIFYLLSKQEVLVNSPLYKSKIKEEQTLWHKLSSNDTAENDTLVWHIAHYEHRDFPYGRPAIVMMIFHYHNKTLPSIWLKTCNDKYCDCLPPQWVPYGKLVNKIRKEVKYFFNAVFKIQPNTTSVHDSVDAYNDSNCTDSGLIIEDMPVYYETKEKKIEFAVCLYKGIIAKDSFLLDMASWIEINRAIGVEHITMYDQDIGPNITRLLKNYEKEGFVKLIDWKIYNPDFTIANNGQLANANDCFYRYLRRAKYVLFIDLDELIIPHSTATLGDMMNSLSKFKNIVQYRFYNSFWHESQISLVNDTKELPIHFRRLNRTKNPPETIRYKNIIRMEAAVRIGIHHIYQMKKGYKMYQVPEHVGLMHHYRTPDYARKEEQLTDKILSKYFNTVMKRLANVTLFTQV
ncbi:PREDICTED: glycosyltransferase family 92 protein RCOM_0530710-like [Amphimedon queenslandica]|uniref:Glycosyltransferase family 92 protein n=1 Tax=Amphimedon queenslandica TaxID=400682 RepID=A0A1X7VCX8_AMPQE|nr:PREDICTED: glycosyltransferase family 92 protein RCOM_0530710-like [Amphimedon queenslandica]|eukprot:XP_019849480.1 PREDICTED: glycosyltransferase family 92 protein RCOM_0530710-like [Amphimedon queenslandica]